MDKAKHAPPIGDRVKLARRYMRSVEISRDLNDPRGLDGYILTPSAKDALHRLVSAFQPGSTHRAFRISGPYGTGKSAFGLFLARLFLDRLNGQETAEGILKAVDTELLREFEQTENYFPLVLTGFRGNIAEAIVEQVLSAAKKFSSNKAFSNLIRRAQKLKKPAEIESGIENKALSLLRDFSGCLAANKIADGALLIIDEMGRFLEYAALHPGKIDASIFQSLAENAAGDSAAPLSVICFLHHRFSDYVANLGIDYELEWTRSAERYEEIPFQNSGEHFTHLVSEAIERPNTNAQDRSITKKTKELYDIACKKVGLGALASSSQVFARLYPLHPTVVSSLAALSRTFGQNERSVFSFLQSSEYCGFQEFIKNAEYQTGSFYRLHHLADYVLAHVDWFPRAGDRARRIQHFSDSIRVAHGLPEKQEQLLKTVGLISVLPAGTGLVASSETLSFSLSDQLTDKDVTQALAALVKRGLIYQRPQSGDFCLWSNTSVDLEEWWKKATQDDTNEVELVSLFDLVPAGRPLVAHRHYHEKGTLRTFDVQLSGADELGTTVSFRKGCDGTILTVAVPPKNAFKKTIELCKAGSKAYGPTTLLCVRKIPSQAIALASELRSWRWIKQNCPDLRVDDIARREVDERIRACSNGLTDLLAPFSESLGQDHDLAEDVTWVHAGKEVSIASRSALNSFLSNICDEVFSKAPIIKNELVNRTKLSSAASSARQRLIEKMIEDAPLEHLGIAEMPPEKAIYLSLFRSSGIHRPKDGERWGFQAPPKKDPCSWRYVWSDFGQYLETHDRCDVAAALNFLEGPPYGLRPGVSILFFAGYLFANRRHVALLERGSFVPEITGAHFMRLIKNPSNFEVRYMAKASQVDTYLNQLSNECILWRDHNHKPEAHASAAAEHLYLWFRSLSEFALKTDRLSNRAQKVREALRKATEPLQLINVDLPIACDASPFPGDGADHSDASSQVIEILNASLQEIEDALPSLEDQVRKEILEAFDASSVPAVRARMQREYLPNIEKLTDYTLRSVVIRSGDDARDEGKWLRSMASAVTGRTMENWGDEQLDQFVFEIRAIGKKLARWLATVREQAAESIPIVSIHILDVGGNEESLVVSPDSKLSPDADKLATKISNLLIGYASPERILGKLLAESVAKRQSEKVKDGQ
jgi:hypothetical protein